MAVFDNDRVNAVELELGLASLASFPRQLTLVLGDRCNIDCPHCYQEKTGDELLAEPAIGLALRREFATLYPYLDTLRLQGGEAFAIRSFRDLLEDLRCTVERPLVSVSTNGTLIDDRWADTIVELPFRALTFSFDAGTATTFAQMRRGASFEQVIANVRRIQRRKAEKGSRFPVLDAFFVVMRSNFREIPDFMALMLELGIRRVAFQTLLVDDRNLAREPGLLHEQLHSRDDAQALHQVMHEALARFEQEFEDVSFSGLHDVFETHGLATERVAEERRSLCPGRPVETVGGVAAATTPGPPGDSAPAPSSAHCPNPWTTLFVAENGDVSLCYLAQPVGNIYEQPLLEIWNGPRAIAHRSHVVAGRYRAGGCSTHWCRWREGRRSESDGARWRELLSRHRSLVEQLSAARLPAQDDLAGDALRAVRRRFRQQRLRIETLEANLSLLWEENGEIHRRGQAHIDLLEARLQALQGVTPKVAQPAHPARGPRRAAPAGPDTGPISRLCARLGLRPTSRVGAAAGPQAGASNGTRSYCTRPFELLEVHEDGVAWLCCPTWVDGSIGRLTAAAREDPWNGKAAQDMRAAIIDGSFRRCDTKRCPYLATRSGPVGTLSELRNRGVSEAVLRDLEAERTRLDHGPLAINGCHDRSCNLHCPSCRKGPIMADGEDRIRAAAVQNLLRERYLPGAEQLFITGSGDPFGSPLFRRWLTTMTESEARNLRFIHLHTNGLMLTERTWAGLADAAVRRIRSLEISIDGASRAVYEANRPPARWSRLVANLDFARRLRASGELESVGISMVVQQNNFREIGAFVALCERFGFDEARFAVIEDWFPGDPQAARRYREKAVHIPTHPEHAAFVEAVQRFPWSCHPVARPGNLASFC